MDDIEPKAGKAQHKVWCTPELKKLWERAAKKSRRDLADWTRITLTDAAMRELNEEKPE